MKKCISERLTAVRLSLGLNKAEAARLLNLSKMGYGRYESGERIPSPQTLEVIAQKFGTSVAYLTGKSDSSRPDTIVIERDTSKELFALVRDLQDADEATLRRLWAYYKELSKMCGGEIDE